MIISCSVVRRLLGSAASRILLENALKERLRKVFWKGSDPLFRLDRIIREVEILDDGLLCVKLCDGTRLAGLPGGVLWARMKYLQATGLDRMRIFENYTSLLGLLSDIYIWQQYERHFVPKAGQTVIDIGAHVGVFTVKMARAVGDTGRVIAIEPRKKNLEVLHRNIKANGLKNVTIISLGAWNKKDTLKLNLFTESTALSSFHTDHFEGTAHPDAVEEVAVDTLDSIFAELGIRTIDFIKMDIEGAEIEALPGMRNTLENSGLNLAIACYHVVNGQESSRTIIPELEGMGFETLREGGVLYAHKKM